MDSLVGYTGFVGSNLALKHKFDGLFNSKNISHAFYTTPDLLVYSGVRAEKFLANQNEKADLAIIENAIENIKKINPQKLILISTIDVYKNPVDVDEDTEIDTTEMQPYGLNRYYLEKWVRSNIPNCLIVRLPGLYGVNIKKNFIYDLIYMIPTMLNKSKYLELSEKSELVNASYQIQNNGFYRCRELTFNQRMLLKKEFLRIGFSALNFTDSRGSFQFYNLGFLWGHITLALEKNINILNLATEPVQIHDLYQYIYGENFVNEIAAYPPSYNYKTKYSKLFAGNDGYIFSKEFVMRDIKNFVEEYK